MRIEPSVLRRFIDRHRRVKLQLAAALTENSELLEEVTRLKVERREMQKRLWRERQTLREAQKARDKWHRLCQGYENQLGHRRKDKLPQGRTV